MEQFALALLAGFGIAPVPGAVSFLLRWASFEGTYLAAWNPLNTMYPAHDGNRWNPQGVAAYDTLEEGVNATIRTLEDDDRYQPIIRTLETGDVMTKAVMCRSCGFIEIVGDVAKLRRLTSEPDPETETFVA